MEQRTFFRGAVRRLAEEHGIAFEDRAAVRRLMRGHRNALIEAYARAEESGLVPRKSNVCGIGAKRYGAYFFGDACRKSWVFDA